MKLGPKQLRLAWDGGPLALDVVTLPRHNHHSLATHVRARSPFRTTSATISLSKYGSTRYFHISCVENRQPF